MTAADQRLVRLARLAGVAADYRDARNTLCRVPLDTVRGVLAAMGIDASTPGAVEAGSAALEAAEWDALLPPVATTVAGAGAGVPIVVDAGSDGTVAWRLHCESGEERSGTVEIEPLTVLAERRERHRRRQRLLLPVGRTTPPGYHRLSVALGGEQAETLLVVAPRFCYQAPALAAGRAWALTTQLYSLRSARNWGIGDFSDLSLLAEAAARHGAGALGINPLHALFPAAPGHISPYSPSSRLFLNPLYLDLAAVPDFAGDAPAEALAAARAGDLVDYARVVALKRPAFEACYRAFAARHLGAAPTARGADFRRFQSEGGRALERFAVFTALHEDMLAQGAGFSWQDWPAPLRQSHSAAVARFAVEQRDRVEMHQYLQWEADRQLAGAAGAGVAAGLSLGLYRDLAVGVDPNGAEAWDDPGMMVTGATVGAPPDILNLKGQDWGLAPVNPVALRRAEFQPFIAALRANMRHAGLLRIDHVMALMHLYWVPRGAGPAEGTYVTYPFEALRHILQLESERRRCAVIGEDLGTVPEGFREVMAQAGVLSYRLMLFERDRDGGFLAPGLYPELASAAFSTHDLATVRGFWLGRDLEHRRELALYPDTEAGEQERRDRRRDRRLLLEALIAADALPPAAMKRLLPKDDHPVFEPELIEAVQRFLGASRAALVLVQIEDVLGEIEQANLPGTVNEHPNWRRRLARALDEILVDPEFARVAAALREARGAP
ncbi:MAG TPA: 4-alpha-glucanotransferase [Stellaceae bacterium]|jgi:4-alpha-glucanotransferase|nr:4-alpha-glucanotransferase [Stellaceae bacterium]